MSVLCPDTPKCEDHLGPSESFLSNAVTISWTYRLCPRRLTCPLPVWEQWPVLGLWTSCRVLIPGKPSESDWVIPTPSRAWHSCPPSRPWLKMGVGSQEKTVNQGEYEEQANKVLRSIFFASEKNSLTTDLAGGPVACHALCKGAGELSPSISSVLLLLLQYYTSRNLITV